MRDPGSDLMPWHEGERIEGVLQARPYPIVWSVEGDRLVPTILVRQGKFGLRSHEVMHLDGQPVSTQGLLLSRDGVRMLEVGQAPRRANVSPAVIARARMRSTRPLGNLTFQGEIEDSKCYLGRMRPGQGRGHRACAQLCVIGGIPPMLVTSRGAYLVALADGSDAHNEVVDFVAEPVRVTGSLEQTESLGILRIDPRNIERVTVLGGR
jgi:hypothetical protein